MPQGQTARPPEFGTGVRQSVSLPDSGDSLIETKQNNYSWKHSQISGGSMFPAWNMTVCSSMLLFASRQRCESLWGSVYFRVDIKSYFTSRFLSKRPNDYVIWHLQKTNPIRKHFNVLFYSDLWLLQFTYRSSFYNQVYLGEKIYEKIKCHCDRLSVRSSWWTISVPNLSTRGRAWSRVFFCCSLCFLSLLFSNNQTNKIYLWILFSNLKIVLVSRQITYNINIYVAY